jgi:hypothetical protein
VAWRPARSGVAAFRWVLLEVLVLVRLQLMGVGVVGGVFVVVMLMGMPNRHMPRGLCQLPLFCSGTLLPTCSGALFSQPE